MISEDDVKYIARLSRIHLKQDEARQLTKTLEDILHYIKKLETLDVKNIKPTSHVLEMKNVYRDDTVVESLPQDTVMNMAIDKYRGSFKVPKVIE